MWYQRYVLQRDTEQQTYYLAVMRWRITKVNNTQECRPPLSIYIPPHPFVIRWYVRNSNKKNQTPDNRVLLLFIHSTAVSTSHSRRAAAYTETPVCFFVCLIVRNDFGRVLDVYKIQFSKGKVTANMYYFISFARLLAALIWNSFVNVCVGQRFTVWRHMKTNYKPQ